jgi:hypothetical protein
VGVGELVHVGVTDGTIVGDGEGVAVADVAADAVGKVGIDAVRRSAPDGAAAGTVGRLVNVGNGLGAVLGTGLGVRPPTVGGSAKALLPCGGPMLQLVKANKMTNRTSGRFRFSLPPLPMRR